jgi:hypothetical protein
MSTVKDIIAECISAQPAKKPLDEPVVGVSINSIAEMEYPDEQQNWNPKRAPRNFIEYVKKYERLFGYDLTRAYHIFGTILHKKLVDIPQEITDPITRKANLAVMSAILLDNGINCSNEFWGYSADDLLYFITKYVNANDVYTYESIDALLPGFLQAMLAYERRYYKTLAIHRNGKLVDVIVRKGNEKAREKGEEMMRQMVWKEQAEKLAEMEKKVKEREEARERKEEAWDLASKLRKLAKELAIAEVEEKMATINEQMKEEVSKEFLAEMKELLVTWTKANEEWRKANEEWRKYEEEAKEIEEEEEERKKKMKEEERKREDEEEEKLRSAYYEAKARLQLWDEQKECEKKKWEIDFRKALDKAEKEMVEDDECPDEIEDAIADMDAEMTEYRRNREREDRLVRREMVAALADCEARIKEWNKKREKEVWGWVVERLNGGGE